MRSKEISITRYWSGEIAPESRHAFARPLWSDKCFLIRFETVAREPMVMSHAPDVSKKTIGLWDRDVCEIFIAPDASNRNRYFEFEVAPTGEWVDLAINSVSPETRETDITYESNMKCSSRIMDDRSILALEIPWTAFSAVPRSGDIWFGNLFRCVGSGETRGYLAWQPTETVKPDFHIPSKFGELLFVGTP